MRDLLAQPAAQRLGALQGLLQFLLRLLALGDVDARGQVKHGLSGERVMQLGVGPFDGQPPAVLREQRRLDVGAAAGAGAQEELLHRRVAGDVGG